MKKIKRSAKPQPKKPMDLRAKIILSVGVGVLVILVIILIIIESTGGKMIIRNQSDEQLEYIKAFFVDAEGPVSYPIEITDLEPGGVSDNAMERINLLGREANLELRFKFTGYDEELFVDSGYFNDVFKGKVSISFTQESDDLIRLAVKASSGVLRSNLVSCDEVHDVYYKEGFIAE